MNDTHGTPSHSNCVEISDPTRLVDKPLVSVAIATYNQEGYLADAIAGALLQQTDFPIEVLIGEDCSPDRTREVALDYQRRHPELIRVFAWQRNVGGHANFRHLIKCSRGEFVAVVDGDDYWIAPTKLQRQVDVLRARSDVTAVFTDYVTATFEDGQWSLAPRSALAGRNLDKLRGVIRGIPPAGELRTLTSLYRIAILRNLHARLPIEDYPFGDNFMLAEATQTGSVECLDLVSAVYRLSPGSSTRSGPAATLEFHLRQRDYLTKFSTFFPRAGSATDADLRGADLQICRAAYMAGDLREYENAYLRLRATAAGTPAYLTALRWMIKVPYLRQGSIAAWSRMSFVHRKPTPR